MRCDADILQRHIEADQFKTEYSDAGKPVLVQNLLHDWPAMDKWTKPYLTRAVGAWPVRAATGRDIVYFNGKFGDSEFTPLPRFFKRARQRASAAAGYVFDDNILQYDSNTSSFQWSTCKLYAVATRCPFTESAGPSSTTTILGYFSGPSQTRMR